MKKFFSISVLFLSNLLLQAQPSKDEKAILDILQHQSQAWSHGQIEDYMKGYWENDSLLYIGKSGVTYGYQNTLNTYKKNYKDSTEMGKLFFDILHLKRLAPDYYWVVGKWFLKRSKGDASGQFTLLFRKIKGHWVIVADHSS